LLAVVGDDIIKKGIILSLHVFKLGDTVLERENGALGGGKVGGAHIIGR
jgi:hypothetical protein